MSRALLLALPALLLLQLVRPELANPPAPADFQAPAAVKHILETSCYSCHSNETRLSWFDRIVPAWWLVAHDVKKARAHLNFSELGAQPASRQRAALFEAVNQIQMGVMPLRSYTSLHPEAVVTPIQVAILRDYLLPAPTSGRAVPNSDAANAQYLQRIAAAGAPFPVRAAPNGIAFLPDYRNWQVISTADRIDTGTLKLILGNETAIKAIADNRIKPWPDGTTFAKVQWRQQPDDNGAIRTGAFLQVAFMIKNSRKYSATAGWGWAEWLGTELKPYGKNAGFAAECVACHAPLRNNDYVFTMPIPARGSVR